MFWLEASFVVVWLLGQMFLIYLIMRSLQLTVEEPPVPCGYGYGGYGYGYGCSGVSLRKGSPHRPNFYKVQDDNT